MIRNFCQPRCHIDFSKASQHKKNLLTELGGNIAASRSKSQPFQCRSYDTLRYLKNATDGCIDVTLHWSCQHHIKVMWKSAPLPVRQALRKYTINTPKQLQQCVTATLMFENRNSAHLPHPRPRQPHQSEMLRKVRLHVQSLLLPLVITVACFNFVRQLTSAYPLSISLSPQNPPRRRGHPLLILCSSAPHDGQRRRLVLKFTSGSPRTNEL